MKMSLADVLELTILEMLNRLNIEDQSARMRKLKVIERNIVRDMVINRHLEWFRIDALSLNNTGKEPFALDFMAYVEVPRYLLIQYFDKMGKEGIHIERFETEEDLFRSIDDMPATSLEYLILISDKKVLNFSSVRHTRIEGVAENMLDPTLQAKLHDDFLLGTGINGYWEDVKNDKPYLFVI